MAESDNIGQAVSSPIPFDASVEQMSSALFDIGSIRAASPRITVHRVANQYNGYTWTIEVQGMGELTRLQLFKSTLYAVAEGDNTLTKVRVVCS